MTHITGNTTIGSDVFISTMVGMTNDNAMGKAGYHEGAIVGPTIEDGAMIGAGATLLPGVVIGAGAVAAWGAGVHGSVALGVTVVGVQARPSTRTGAAR
jgi:acetyltransferase-like isoleucine patch superfamily enzyme